MNNWPNRIRSFTRQTREEWRDIAAAIADVSGWVWRGIVQKHRRFDAWVQSWFAPKDPARFAQTPPEYWFEKTPEADVPKRAKKSEVIDLELYTDEEIAAMGKAEYMAKIGLAGIETYEEATKKARQRIARKNNAKEV